MSLMSRHTGRTLTDTEHLRQSVVDILTTPIGSRVMLRDYGSRLFDLIDTAQNRSGVMDIYAAVVDALGRWEPRLSVQKVNVTPGAGKLTLAITGSYNGRALNFTGIEVER